MKAESTKKIRLLTQEERLESLVNDYTTRKQPSLIQMKKGIISRESFLAEARQYVEEYMEVTREEEDELCQMFEQYIFGYSRLSPLIDDPTISDIRVISHDNIRVKREGVRMDGGIAFLSEKNIRQFIDYVSYQESGQYFQCKCHTKIYGYGKPSGFHPALLLSPCLW